MVNILFITFFFAFVVPTEVHAYLDPGAGSHLLQLILGLVLGALFSLKIFWKKIKIFLKRIFS